MKNKNTQKVNKKQMTKKDFSSRHKKIDTLEKVRKNNTLACGADVKGKQIQNKLMKFQRQIKRQAKVIIQKTEERSHLWNKKIFPVKNFYQVVKNQQRQKNKLLIPQFATNRYKEPKLATQSPLKNGLLTQRVKNMRNSKYDKEFCHINEEILTQRRENRLNSKFKQRVNRLNDITRENKRIYCRINSQRSHYLKEQMNKSYESNMQISRRLSMSKVSQRSGRSQKSSVNGNSRCSNISNLNMKSSKNKSFNKNGIFKGALTNNNTQQNSIKIESKNINELKNHQLEHFATLFEGSRQTKNLRIKSRMSAKNIKSTSYKENINHTEAISKTLELKKIPRHQNKQKLPKINLKYQIYQNNQLITQNMQKISFSKKKILSVVDQNIPSIRLSKNINFLHKIIEQPIKTSKLIFTFESLVR